MLEVITASNKSIALTCASLLLMGVLAACGGSSNGEAGSQKSPTSSVTPSASPQKELPPEFISLTGGDAAEAKKALKGVAGVSRTEYDKRHQRFFIYYLSDVTRAQRQHVKDVIYGVLGY